MFIDLEFLRQICIRNYSNKEVKAQKKKKRKTTLDVDQCVGVWRVLSRHMNEIGSLGLQKFVIAIAMGFSGVPPLCCC